MKIQTTNQEKNILERSWHGLCGHTTDDCTALMALISQGKQNKSKQSIKEKRQTKNDVNVMVGKKIKKALKKKKKLTDEIRAFEKMSISASEQEYLHPEKRAKFIK